MILKMYTYIMSVFKRYKIQNNALKNNIKSTNNIIKFKKVNLKICFKNNILL